MQIAPTQHMRMDMENRLPRLPVSIQNDPVAGLSDPIMPCHLCTAEQQSPQ